MMEKVLARLHIRHYDPDARKVHLDRVETMEQLANDIRTGRRTIRVIEENDDSVDFMRGRPSGRQ